MAQTAARTAPSGHGRMRQPRPQRLPLPEPGANVVGDREKIAGAPGGAGRAEVAGPERLWRRWPLALIVAGLVLSVAWCGLIAWTLANGLLWLAA